MNLTQSGGCQDWRRRCPDCETKSTVGGARPRRRASVRPGARASWRRSSGATPSWSPTSSRRWPRPRRGPTGSRRRWSRRGGRGWRGCSRGCGARAEPAGEEAVTDTDEARRKRSEAARRAAATKGPERRREAGLKGAATRGPESYRQSGLKAAAAKTPEERRASARKIVANRDPEAFREAVRKALAARSPEARREAARKAAETRRRNREAAKGEA